jgi:hypothetical protein
LDAEKSKHVGLAWLSKMVLIQDFCTGFRFTTYNIDCSHSGGYKG